MKSEEGEVQSEERLFQSKLLDLDELDKRLGLGLEGLGDDDTPVITEKATVEDCVSIGESLNLVN